MTPLVYPLPAPGEDPRFTFGLIHDVAGLLEAAGYPRLAGLDVVELRQALYRFLYVPRAGGSPAGPRGPA